MSIRVIPSEGDPLSNSDAFATRYLEVLNDRLGWDASVDADGDLAFGLSELRSDGGIRARIDNHAQNDPEYLRFHTGVRLAQEGGADEHSLGAVAADLSRQLKLAKLAVDGAYLIVSVEMIAAGSGCPPSRPPSAGTPRSRKALWGCGNTVLRDPSAARYRDRHSPR